MNGIHISETLSVFPVKSREVEEQGEASAGGGEEIVGRNVELFGDAESWGAEEVDDKGEDSGVERYGPEGMVDIRIVED